MIGEILIMIGFVIFTTYIMWALADASERDCW
jgi:hypothetical protein